MLRLVDRKRSGTTSSTWTKQVASSYGGTRNGMVVHWPKAIKVKGEVRSQWHHVINVAPTILKAAGLPEPKVVNGVPHRCPTPESWNGSRRTRRISPSTPEFLEAAAKELINERWAKVTGDKLPATSAARIG